MNKKSKTTKISVEEVAILRSRLREINCIPFEQIVWLKGGIEQMVDIVSSKEWDCIGLNNTDFPDFYNFENQTLGDGANV